MEAISLDQTNNLNIRFGGSTFELDYVTFLSEVHTNVPKEGCNDDVFIPIIQKALATQYPDTAKQLNGVQLITLYGEVRKVYEKLKNDYGLV
jgi:hypothetical protein